jgi:hypothetical protein
MPVPSSGQLRLRADINQEINGNDTDDNVSLGTLSNDAGFTEPDEMSDFYGYSSCGTPAYRTVYSSANPNGDIQLYTILDYLPYCNTTEYGLYVGTNSSGPTANTKYQVGTSWGVYSWAYPTVGGFTNGQTYYAWIYCTNSAGKTGYSSMQTVTVPAAYIPVSHSSMNPYGDMSSLWCPNNNFNGGFRPLFTNSTSNTSLDVYGDGNFTHTNSSYPNCKATFGSWPPQSSSRQPSCSLRSSTCRVYAGQSEPNVCGNSVTGYVKYYYSGYSDRIFSHSVSCQAC